MNPENTTTITSLAALEERIRTGIPIAAHMDFRVLELSQNSIRVRGGGAENINVHGTAFAGSLYCTCALALWGLVNSRLPPNASLVMAKADIHYQRPVIGDIIAECEIPDGEMIEFLKAVNTGKGRLYATVRVIHNEKTAVEFTGTVYARLQNNH
jgi:thioesterase domain-containing protein